MVFRMHAPKARAVRVRMGGELIVPPPDRLKRQAICKLTAFEPFASGWVSKDTR